MGHILVIDDDASFCDASASLLRCVGHNVMTAYSGAGGLRTLRARKVDLVLTDFFLGDCTAVDLLKRLRQSPLEVPVIVFTGMGAIRSAVEAMKLGAVEYLLKPLDFDEVANAIELQLAPRLVDGQVAPHGHAVARWASAVVGLLRSPVDVRNITEWGRVVAVSPGALRNRCAVAGLSPRRSLLLARLLRAVFRSEGREWVPRQVLSVADLRTLDRLLALGGLSRRMEGPSVGTLLERQALIVDQAAMNALRSAITAIVQGSQDHSSLQRG